MTPTAPARRSYDASGRRAAAEQRRHHVADVAARLFADRGWSATTLSLVAAEAGVSPELVTKSFGGKQELFMVAFRRASFGARGTLPQAFAAMGLEDEPDVAVRLDRIVEFACDALVPMAPLVAVMAVGADQDPVLEQLVGAAQVGHAETAAEVVRLLATGPVGPDVVDEVYVLTRSETYLALVQQRGWSLDRYAAWLRRALVRAVSAQG